MEGQSLTGRQTIRCLRLSLIKSSTARPARALLYPAPDSLREICLPCAASLTASSLHSINTRVVNSSLLYDIVLVAVIGGIGLSGGKGGVRNVLIGAALIGILLDAMTIIDIPLLYQNLIKAAILLAAIIVDGILNPRDEQTAQQGDI